MAVYIIESEITDFLVRDIKEDPSCFTEFIDPYLLRCDNWYISTAKTFGVAEADIITYAGGQQYKVIELLRAFVYKEVLNDLYSINSDVDDDYYKKLGKYLKNFDALFNSLTREMITGEDPVVDVTPMTGQRITLATDMYPYLSTESEF